MNLVKNAIILETKKRLFSNLTGGHSSLFRGSGVEFRDLQEYNTSDSARHINWKKSSKSKVYVNSFEADRELNIVLVYLNSGSLDFAGKKQKAIEALTALSFASIESKESLSTIFFNQKEQKFFKPSRKRVAVDINFEVSSSVNYQGEIDYKMLENYILHTIKKRSLIFIIGDFLDEVNLQTISLIHEVYAVIIRAKEEENLELLGELNIVDKNSQSQSLLNINKSSQKVYNKLFKKHDIRLFRHFNSCQINYTKVYNSSNTISKLKELTNG